jgi:hypothetical protein
MCHFGDDTKARLMAIIMVMIPMQHLNSTQLVKLKCELKENILQVEYSLLKYRRLDND